MPQQSRVSLGLCLRIQREILAGKKKKMAKVGGVTEIQGNENSLAIDGLARFAVDEHNKKENALLEFKKVVKTKQQVVAGTMYYITLEASDGGHNKLYEAKVWEKPWENFKELQEFKLLNSSS